MTRWNKVWDVDETEREISGKTVIVWIRVPLGHFPITLAYLEDGEWFDAHSDNPIEYQVVAWYDLPDYVD